MCIRDSLRTLRHNAGNGHTCLPRAQLLETASNFIHQPPEKLAAALDSCIQTGKLEVRMFDGTPYIYLPDLLAAEQDIADRLAMLTRRGKQTARNLDKNIQILELAQGFAYAPLQKEAIRKAMTETVSYTHLDVYKRQPALRRSAAAGGHRPRTSPPPGHPLLR